MLKHIDSTRLSLIAVAVGGALFFAVNIVANVWFGNLRADFTETSSYTTSAQLSPIFESINEPIVVRLYYSEAVGQLSPRHSIYYQRVRDLLQQYAKLAKGNIKLELYNPSPFSDVEDRAVGFGMQGLPLSQSGEVGYFGLAATNSTDDQQTIPFFSIERERFLEYDLAKLIYTLARPTQPKIGMITSLKIEGTTPTMQQMQAGPENPAPPWAIMQQIREFFTVQTLAIDVPQIPADIDLLLLAQPENLSQQTQLAIDQFVLGGGKVLAFVDPNAETNSALANMGSPEKRTPGTIDGMKKLMAAWGVSLAEGKIVGDADAAIRVNLAIDGRPIISDYVAWIRLQGDSLDADDAVTGDLKQVNFGTAGALDAVEGAGTTITPLIVTGPRSMRIDVDRFVGMPDIVRLFREFQPLGKREIIAARITGPAKSAFPEAQGTLRESKQPIQVVVVADSDMLADRFWVETNNMMGQQVMVPTSDNGSFVSNALENLTGAPALSSLRGHSVQSHPFTLIEDIRRDAEMQYRAKEQSLTSRLEELQKKVDDMQVKRDGSGAAVLSEQDKKTIENYRGDILATRRELRDVQRALRENIDRLERAITFANIGGVPLAFGLILIAAAVIRYRRRRHRAGDV